MADSERELHLQGDAPVRRLTAEQLGVTPAGHSSNRPDDPVISDDDPRLLETRDLLQRFGGVIFTGPPGTSKTFYAAQIGTKLAGGEADRIRFVQFHPSYQYEDFIEGFVPRDDGSGFDLKAKTFVQLCAAAKAEPNQTYVLVIDELSRGDPGRVFGEALTYVERSKRGLEFQLASGETLAVPANLVVLATMNPMDRGVDEVDAAFERRFAKIAMEPSPEILDQILHANGMADSLRGRVLRFFAYANQLAETTPMGAIGHTYFRDARDAATLRSLWDHQLRFLIDKAYRLEPQTADQLRGKFESLLSEGRSEGEEPEPAEGDSADEDAA